MRTGRRPDTITDERQVAERVRKLEVMPNPRTIQAPAWNPDRDDLYAIAGHILMLGCFSRPYQTGSSGPWAKVYQASQHLWASLDQRGFTSDPEAQQWTEFLMRMGALFYWERFMIFNPHGYVFSELPPMGAYAEEARLQILPGPNMRIGFVGPSGPEGVPHFRARALWFTGFPPDVEWMWTPASTPGDLAGFDNSSYMLWDDTGPVNQGYFENPERPVAAQANFWVNTIPDPDQIVPCGQLPDQYNSHVHLGIPMGPFPTAPLPCEGMALGSTVGGDIHRYRLVMPGWQGLFLLCPPRIQDPRILSNDLRDVANHNGGEIISTGPSLDWLAEGASVLLPEYPAVQSFYNTYLPIAYNSGLRAHHYNWQQLQTSVAVRGRVEAQYHPDRVILKGQLYCPTEQLDPELFHWPDGWAHPAEATVTQPAFTAGNGEGGTVPLAYVPSTRRFVLGDNWGQPPPFNHGEPLLVRLDGMTIPLRLDETGG